MKTRFSLEIPLFALLLATGAVAWSQAPSAAPGAPRELAVEVIDTLGANQSNFRTYERISRVFAEVFRARKWPLKVNIEEFAANNPAHPVEMRIFFQGIRDFDLGDLTFSAWITLDDHGTKHDFGIVRFRYYPHPEEPLDDRLDKAVRGAANITADKIEALLFPKTGGAKP